MQSCKDFPTCALYKLVFSFLSSLDCLWVLNYIHITHSNPKVIRTPTLILMYWFHLETWPATCVSSWIFEQGHHPKLACHYITSRPWAMEVNVGTHSLTSEVLRDDILDGAVGFWLGNEAIEGHGYNGGTTFSPSIRLLPADVQALVGIRPSTCTAMTRFRSHI